MTPLQLGIIGCGTIGSVHAQAAAASEQIELAAVADVDLGLAEKAAAAHRVEKVYNSGAELLADPQIEAVVLALPALFRVELGLQALRGGKHLLTEKPVARSAGEVRQLISAQGAGSRPAAPPAFTSWNRPGLLPTISYRADWARCACSAAAPSSRRHWRRRRPRRPGGSAAS